MKARLISSISTPSVRLVSALILAALIISACQPAAASSPLPPTLVPTTAPTTPPTTAPTSQPAAAPTATPTTAPTPAPTDTPAASSTPAFNEPTLSVANHPTLGNILVGDNGMTLYIFTQDEPDKSNCDADCLEMWPPLLTQGSPKLGQGVDPTLVGSATLADGSIVVTYNRMPLYYWSQDAQPGDAAGEGVGNVWFVISPAGVAVYPQKYSQPTKSPSDNGGYGSNY